MPLELRPATEADAARAAEIEHIAYASSPFDKILFPGPFPGDGDGGPAGAGVRAAQLVDELRADPTTTRWLKVVDTDLAPSNAGGGDKAAGENHRSEAMVAFARWHIYTEDAPPRSALSPFGPGCNQEACQMLFGGIHEQRRRLMGDRPYVYLKLLHTDPKHQGRGAGGMLVRWGVEEARRRGVPAYLESSEAGHSLYRKYGFRDLELQSLDFSRWGATQKHNTWAMIYEPSSGP